MVQDTLSAHVQFVDPGIAVIQVRGEINLYSANVLMDAYAEATRQKAHTFILNFSALESLNSAGIGVLVTMLLRAHQNQQRLVICCLKQHYREIFNLTGLDEVVPTYADETEALQRLAPA
jgi:anti-sigma B factor antagonist